MEENRAGDGGDEEEEGGEEELEEKWNRALLDDSGSTIHSGEGRARANESGEETKERKR